MHIVSAAFCKHNDNNENCCTKFNAIEEKKGTEICFNLNFCGSKFRITKMKMLIPCDLVFKHEATCVVLEKSVVFTRCADHKNGNLLNQKYQPMFLTTNYKMRLYQKHVSAFCLSCWLGSNHESTTKQCSANKPQTLHFHQMKSSYIITLPKVDQVCYNFN